MFVRVTSGYFLQDLLQLDCPSNRNLVFLLRNIGGLVCDESEDGQMGVSYKKLFKLLIDRGMKKKDLQEAAGLSPASVTKLAKDAYVRLEVLVKVCCALSVDIGDIMEVTGDD